MWTSGYEQESIQISTAGFNTCNSRAVQLIWQTLFCLELNTRHCVNSNKFSDWAKAFYSSVHLYTKNCIPMFDVSSIKCTQFETTFILKWKYPLCSTVTALSYSSWTESLKLAKTIPCRWKCWSWILFTIYLRKWYRIRGSVEESI